MKGLTEEEKEIMRRMEIEEPFWGKGYMDSPELSRPNPAGHYNAPPDSNKDHLAYARSQKTAPAIDAKRTSNQPWKFDPSWRGIFGATNDQGVKTHEGLLGGILGGAKSLFDDPRRMALISGGLRMADPNSYYDAQGFYSPWGGINAGLNTGMKTFKTMNEPRKLSFKEQEAIKLKSAKELQKTAPGRYKFSEGVGIDTVTGKPIVGSGYRGPFRGTSEDAQDRNILLNPNADTSSAVYASAYHNQAKPRNYPDPVTGRLTVVKPDMSAYLPPTGDYAIQGGGLNNAPGPGQSVTTIQGPGRTKPFSDAQAQSAGFYSRMLDATKTLNKIYAGKDGKPGTADDLKPKDVFSNKNIGLSKLPGGIGNLAVSSEYQMAEQAMKNWVTANLRKESGAAIPPEEQAQEFKKWFPAFGDKPQVIEQKRKARKKVEAIMRSSSQGAYEHFRRKSDKVPTGVTKEEWGFMTPDERKLFE